MLWSGWEKWEKINSMRFEIDLIDCFWGFNFPIHEKSLEWEEGKIVFDFHFILFFSFDDRKRRFVLSADLCGFVHLHNSDEKIHKISRVQFMIRCKRNMSESSLMVIDLIIWWVSSAEINLIAFPLYEN